MTAGVLAAVGLHAHKAAADEEVAPPPTDAGPSTTTSTTQPPGRSLISDAQRAQLERARAAAQTVPEGEGPIGARAPAPPTTIAAVTAPVPAPDLPDRKPSVDRRRAITDDLVRRSLPARQLRIKKALRLPGAVDDAPAPAPLEPKPADDRPGDKKEPAAPATAISISTSQVTPKATPPPAASPASSDDAWYPAWVAAQADARIAERWRTSPVRGPPPSLATALGNDARTTITQVAVVHDRSGHLTVSVASQTATVQNVGLATTDGHGGGDATAVGNRSDTTILQVSVIEQRGTGTATVVQSASVDNVGTANATTAGVADATAVGNESKTSVTQIAVVFVDGSGDGHVTQSADVDNVGVANASATDRNATAVGNTSSTDVTQIAVAHVGNDDVNVEQTQNTINYGEATANGGTATGNTATNTTTQVAKV